MKTTIIASGKTDIGRRRSSNQDQYLIAEAFPSLRIVANSLGIPPTSLITGRPQANVMIVADGMGGHQGGSRAAELTIRIVTDQLCRMTDWQLLVDDSKRQEFRDILQSIIGNAHRAVLAESRNDPNFKGMGTTLTLALTLDRDLWVAHVGDSRCYLVRRGAVSKLTRDHTVADQIAARGGLNPSVLENSPWSNVLWNAIGADADEVVADIHHQSTEIGDRYVLCSDGLNKHVGDSEIAKLVAEAANPNQACETLVNTAVERGGSDNVTTIVFEVADGIEESPITRLHVAKTEAVFQLSPTSEHSKNPTTAELGKSDTLELDS